jgi:hypothetical protein
MGKSKCILSRKRAGAGVRPAERTLKATPEVSTEGEDFLCVG